MSAAARSVELADVAAGPVYGVPIWLIPAGPIGGMPGGRMIGGGGTVVPGARTAARGGAGPASLLKFSTSDGLGI